MVRKCQKWLETNKKRVFNMVEPRKRSILVIFAVMAGIVLLAQGPIFILAETTGTLGPASDGSQDSASWIDSGGTACNSTGCYLEVDETSGSDCTSSDGDGSYIRSNSNGSQQTFDVDESGIPNGSLITQISVTFCGRREQPGAGIKPMICLDGNCTVASGVSNVGAAYAEFTEDFTVNYTKIAGSDIEIGVQNNANRGLRVSQVYSTGVTYTYSDSSAPADVTNLGLSSPTGSSIGLSWTAPGDDANFGTATAYDIRYSTSVIDDANWASATQAVGEPSPAVAGSSESMMVSGLNSETTYYFAIKTSDEVPNTSGLSNIPSLSTLDVTDPVISNIQSSPALTTVTITWTTDELSTSQVEYGLTGSYGTQTILDANLVTSHVVEITSLDPETTYHFRVKSKDASDNEAISGENTFDTTTPPDPVISNISSSNITQTSSVVAWDTDISASSQVFYGTSSGSYTDQTSLDSDLVTSHSAALLGLSADTTYYYIVKSVSQYGKVTTSSEHFFTTLEEDAPPDLTDPEITDISVVFISTTEATITWVTDEASTSQVEFGLTTGYGSITTPDTDLVTSHSVTLTGLEPGTLYHFRVKSKDALENEAVSEDNNFVTLTSDEPDEPEEPEEPDDPSDPNKPEGPEEPEEPDEPEEDTAPPVISNIIPIGITDTDATITWTTDEVATSQVMCGTQSGNYTIVIEEDSSFSTSHEVDLSGLAPETTYFCVVKSKDIKGNEAISGEKSFTTESPAPAPPGSPGTTDPETAPGETISIVPILPTEGDKIAPTIIIDEIFPNPTDNQQPTITGKVVDENGVVASLSISLDNGATWHALTTVEGLGTNETIFSFSAPFLEEGNYTILVKAKDNSGNEALSETLTLIIDILPPIFGGKTILVGNQAAPIADDGLVTSVAGLNQKIVLSAKGGPTSIKITAVSRENGSQQVFDLTYNKELGLWTGDMVFEVGGVYDLMLEAEDGANNKTSADLNTFFVQAVGRIINKKTKQLVEEAKVSVYKRHVDTRQWELWPAQSYGQVNPIVTANTGQYQFLVPGGEYYVEVIKDGYRRTVSQIFILEKPGPISGNIYLSQKPGVNIGNFFLTIPSWFFLSDTERVTVAQPEGIEADSFLKPFIDQSIPEIAMLDSNNGTNDLFDQRGRRTVVTLWNTWDSKSQEQMLFLKNVANQDLPITTILPLALQESPSIIKNYLRRGDYGLVSLVDETGSFTNYYPVLTLPQHLFIDRKGILREIYIGLLDEQSLIEKINNL